MLVDFTDIDATNIMTCILKYNWPQCEKFENNMGRYIYINNITINMSSVEKFLYNAVDDDNVADYMLSYLYHVSHKHYPDIILVLNGDNDSIHQFLTLVGGIYYNGCLQSLLPEAHQSDRIDKLNGLFGDDFEVCSAHLKDYNTGKLCFFDCRDEEASINFETLKTMTALSAVIIWTKHLPVVECHDTSTLQKLRIINFTGVKKEEFRMIHKTRDSFQKHTLELEELCEDARDIDIERTPTTFHLINNKCLVYQNVTDASLLEILVEKLRPNDHKPCCDHFGICIPNHPTAMAQLLINGEPILTKQPDQLPDKFDPMRVEKIKINNIKYVFNGWLDHEITTNNMFNDVKWKSRGTLDINVDDLLDSVELFDGFMLCSQNSYGEDSYIISPTKFNSYTVKQTYELFRKLRKEGRLTDQSRVDLFISD